MPGLDVSPGTIIFVPARVHHSFYDITERLALLVFFGRAEDWLTSLPHTKAATRIIRNNFSLRAIAMVAGGRDYGDQ